MDDLIYDQPPIAVTFRGEGREPNSSQLRNYQPSRVSQGSVSPRRQNYTNKKPSYLDRGEGVGARGNTYGNINREPS